MYGFARKTLFAVLLAGVAGPALAADYIEEPIEVVTEVVGGWYIRGHIGMSNQFFDGLESDLFAVPDAFGWYDDGGFSSAPIFGGGIGYQFNDNLRGDITVEWRGKSDFYALDWLIADDTDPDVTTNEYTGKKSELVFMANGYYDFASFSGITPYLGAGIGASYNTISHFRDTNIITGGGAYADDESEWNLAWALHAGLGFQATDRMTIDLGYSFISLGDASTGTLHNDDGVSFPEGANESIKFNDIYSHDFKLGVRYSLN
jgi:opacity protein-like surface antigen